MPKYKDYVNKMIRENQVLFDAFGDLHDQYQLDQNNLQERFNSEGKKVLEVIIEYENKLC